MVRSDDDAGLEAAPFDFLHLQLVGLHVQVNTGDVQRIPLHEFLKQHLVGGDEVSEVRLPANLNSVFLKGVP